MRAKVIGREVFVPSPRPGVGVLGASYYTAADGESLVSIHSLTSRSDTVDLAYVRYSDDGGDSWSAAQTWPTRFDVDAGTRRRHPRGGYVDPRTGRYVSMWTEGVLPQDDPLEGMWRWTMHYAVSEDGGRTDLANEQIIHEGEAYDAANHLPGVSVGKNCVMIGDLGQRPLTRSDGVILLPVQSSPTGPDGSYHNPGAGLTYTDCLVLMGSWRADGRLSWSASERVVADPGRTTRGVVEPTIAELDDGSILMVMRGSNDARPQLPGYKWASRSIDGGRTWTAPEPWTYADGQPFHSPSSCSQLHAHESGRLLWIGNICDRNPRGNGPRYPVVIAEVDRRTGLVVRDTVAAIDTRQPGEHECLTLSNFYAREERGSGDLLVHLPRLFAQGPPAENPEGWTADLMVYRVRIS